MFESLSEKLEGALKSLSGQGRITELNVANSMREVRRALLDADVNYQVARDFTNRIKDQALGEEVLTSVAPSQMLIKIVYEELIQLLGGGLVFYPIGKMARSSPSPDRDASPSSM